MIKTKINRSKRLLCLLTSVIMLIVCLPTGASSYTLSDEEKQKIEGYKSQQSALDDQISAAQSQISAIQDKIADQQAYADQMSAMIEAYQQKIDVINDTIAAYETQIDGIQEEIDALDLEIGEIEVDINHNNILIINSQHEIDDIKNELQASLADVYVNGSTNTLEYLLACSDFSNYLIMMEMSSNKAKHDEEIVATINEDISKIEDINKQNEILIDDLNNKKDVKQQSIDELEAVKTEEEAKADELSATQAEYQALEDEAVALIQSMDAESAAYKATVANYEKQQAALESEINGIIAAAQAAEMGSTTGGGSTSFSGSFIWPLQYSDVYISSSYGYRTSPLTGSYSLHGGVDTCCWSGTQGKAVVATAAGQVIMSTFNGYGNCIMIQHNGTYVSLYGHLDSRAVSVGQYVAQGQTIGYAGNTYGPGGYSTGPHLHFEIRQNGSKVNPTNFCSP